MSKTTDYQESKADAQFKDEAIDLVIRELSKTTSEKKWKKILEGFWQMVHDRNHR